MHQPQAEGTGASCEADALKLTQKNQCDAVNQPTASIQPEKNLIETTMQYVEKQLGYDEAAMPIENENSDII